MVAVPENLWMRWNYCKEIRIKWKEVVGVCQLLPCSQASSIEPRKQEGVMHHERKSHAQLQHGAKGIFWNAISVQDVGRRSFNASCKGLCQVIFLRWISPTASLCFQAAKDMCNILKVLVLRKMVGLGAIWYLCAVNTWKRDVPSIGFFLSFIF